MTLTLGLWPRLKQVGNKIKETGQNIESNAWLISECILYEKEIGILVVQDTILKASKWIPTLGVESHEVSQIMLNQVFFELFEKSWWLLHLE